MWMQLGVDAIRASPTSLDNPATLPIPQYQRIYIIKHQARCELAQGPSGSEEEEYELSDY